MTPIVGLGPHGERAASPDQLSLSGSDADAARAQAFRVAVVLHTTATDWAKQELAGIATTLHRYGARVTEVIECGFDVDAQTRAMERLVREAPDAVIGIPVGGTSVAEAHRAVSRAGIRLVLLDNAPTGLLPGSDYVSVVSSDNFGLGTIAARLLAPHVPEGSKVGILSYQADFFATNEREIAFRKWIGNERPDIVLKPIRFAEIRAVAETLNQFLDEHSDTAGLFAVWDVPAMAAMATLHARSLDLPITTIDLGIDVAVALARGTLIKGVAAQRAYDQGVAAATATLCSLIGRRPPSWLVLPGIPVTAADVLEVYGRIWHAPPPPELAEARRVAPS